MGGGILVLRMMGKNPVEALRAVLVAGALLAGAIASGRVVGGRVLLCLGPTRGGGLSDCSWMVGAAKGGCLIVFPSPFLR